MGLILKPSEIWYRGYVYSQADHKKSRVLKKTDICPTEEAARIAVGILSGQVEEPVITEIEKQEISAYDWYFEKAKARAKEVIKVTHEGNLKGLQDMVECQLRIAYRDAYTAAWSYAKARHVLDPFIDHAKEGYIRAVAKYEAIAHFAYAAGIEHETINFDYVLVSEFSNEELGIEYVDD